MLWLALLVLAGLVTGSDLKLGDRIVATEEECNRLLKLNQNWEADIFHEQAGIYRDLYLTCVDSLNEDKYAYIHENKVDMSWYPDVNDHFPVETSEGARLVTTPPKQKPREEKSLKKKFNEYLTQTGGMYNILYNIMNIQDTMSQDIVNKLVECDMIALFVLQHPNDTESKTKHAECITELNCLKDEFMKHHQFTRDMYPDRFPILYKKRGTMMKTPPQMDKEVCEAQVRGSPEESKKQLEKWMHGIEFIGGKLTDLGEAGSDLIQKLARKEVSGDEKVLTTKELDDLLADKDTGATSEEDEEEEGEENPYKMYRDVILSKLGELGGKGLEITKPAFETVQNLASLTEDKLKEIENKDFKEKSKNALDDLKGGFTLAETAAKLAASKLGGTDFMNKMMPDFEKDENSKDDEAKNSSEMKDKTSEKSKDSQNTENNKKDEDTTSDHLGVLKSLIDHITNLGQPAHDDDENKSTNLIQLLTGMGEQNKNQADNDDNEDNDSLSVEDLEKTLKDLKSKTKKKAEELQLSKDEIKQSADVVKGIMHVLLNSATEGIGTAKDMTKHEIDTAKSLVDELVNYATAEVLGKNEENEEEKGGEEAQEKDSVNDSHEVQKTKELVIEEVTQSKEAENFKSGEESTQTNKAPTENQNTKQKADEEKSSSSPNTKSPENQQNNKTANETVSKALNSSTPQSGTNEEVGLEAKKKRITPEEMRDNPYQDD